MTRTEPDQGGRTHPDRPWLPTVFAITATGILVNTLISSSLPEIVRGVGAPITATGLVIGAATLPGIVLAPVIGILADRYGRRPVILPCLVVFGLAGVAAATVSSLPALLALRVVQGAGSAGLINLAVVVIGDHWSGPDRSRRIGWNAAVLTTVLALLPFVGGVLTDLFSWRAPFAVYGLALLTAVLVWRTLPPVEAAGVDVVAQLRDAVPLLRRRDVAVPVVAATLLFVIIFGLLLTVLPVYLEERFGLSATGRGLVIGAGSVTNTFGALSQGWLRERVAVRPQLVVAGALLALSSLAIGLSPSLVLLVPSVMVFGVGEGLSFPVLQDIVAGASDTHRGLATAWFVSGSRLGQTLGPAGGSAVFAAAGPFAPFVAGALLSVAFLAVAAAGLRSTPEGDDRSGGD